MARDKSEISMLTAGGFALILLGFMAQASAPPRVIEAGAVFLWVTGGVLLVWKPLRRFYEKNMKEDD